MGLLQVVLECCRYFCSATFGIIGHLVQSLAIIIVLQLAEGLHAFVHIVVDNGKAVTVVLERFPTRKAQVLSVVYQHQAALQHIGSTHGRKAVEV